MLDRLFLGHYSNKEIQVGGIKSENKKKRSPN